MRCVIWLYISSEFCCNFLFLCTLGVCFLFFKWLINVISLLTWLRWDDYLLWYSYCYCRLYVHATIINYTTTTRGWTLLTYFETILSDKSG